LVGCQCLDGIKPKVGAVIGEHCHEDRGPFWKIRWLLEFDLPVVDDCLEGDDPKVEGSGAVTKLVY
jgi:hypothetical protein